MPSRPRRKKVTKKSIKKLGLISSLKYVVLVFCSFFVIGGYILYNKLNTFIVGANSSTSSDKSYSTVLVAGVTDLNDQNTPIKHLSLRVIDWDNQRIFTYDVPADYVIEPSEKYGETKIENLFALANLASDGDRSKEITFIKNAVFHIFALPVDSYIFVDDRRLLQWEDVLNGQNFYSFLLGLQSYKKDIDYITDLSLSNLYRVYTLANSLPDDRKQQSHIEGSSLALLDDNLREVTIASQFAKEAKNIAVLNAGDKSGVAGFAGRVVYNLGGRVVSVANSQAKFGENFIVADDVENYSVRALETAFGVKKVLSKSDAKQLITDDDMVKSDILLFVVSLTE